MKIFTRQLKQFLPNLNWTTEKLATKLSMIGHEAEVITEGELEVKVFPNRGDILSLRGMSRDLAGMYPELGECRDVEAATIPTAADFYPLKISDKAKPFVLADHLLKIDGYQATKSPDDIVDLLRPLGLAPKDLLIDLTNIIAYEIGVPLHAFDYQRVKAGMTFDLSTSDEKFTALNGKTIMLKAGVLVLRHNDNQEVTDLVGVMGAADSSVSTGTTSVLLQAGAFDSKIVRHSSKTSGITTEASYRYQRGVDAASLAQALGRLAFLLKRSVPRVEISAYQAYQTTKENEPIIITQDYVSRILGTNVTAKNIQDLTRLGFKVEGDQITKPSWRFDIELPIDLVEEVSRIIGLNTIEPLQLSKINPPESEEFYHVLAIKNKLVELGFSETMTYSFTDDGTLGLQNPRTKDQSFMRNALKEGLLLTLHKNPYLTRSMFFEIGSVFKPKEEVRLGLVVSGKNAQVTQTLQTDLGKLLGCSDMKFLPIEDTAREEYDIKQPKVFYAEIPLSQITADLSYETKVHSMPNYKKISKFPPVIRDVTFVVSTDVELAEILPSLNEPTEVLFAELVDRFESDEKLGAGKIALTFRFIFQSLERSLEDEEATKVLETIFHSLATTVKFEIR